MRAVAFALALLAAPAVTDPALGDTPDQYATPEGMRQFQLCRAAVFYHLDANVRGESRIPLPVIRVMQEQIEFQMQETLWRRTPETLEQGARSIRFAEQFFLGFGQILREERERLVDPAQRDAILFECQAFLWVSMRTQIEELMTWRTRAMDAPPSLGPAETQKRWEETIRRLSR
jgi:hypothetical protein